MTNNPTIDGVSRELLELSAQCLTNSGYDAVFEELRALLDAPVVERQTVAEFEKFARDRCPGVYFGKDAQGDYMAADAKLVLDFWLAGQANAAPPAPVAAVPPSRELLRDKIAEAIGGDTYDCTRVWSAWGVGTMDQDDFVLLVDQEDRLYEIADACLDATAALNGDKP